MSRYIATRAIRGANALVTEAEFMLRKALREKGPNSPVDFPNTAYYLPLIYGMTGLQIENLGQLQLVLEQARKLSNARKCEKGIPSAHALHGLLPWVNTMENKWGAIPVPAAAVTQDPQVATAFIWPKASVAGFVNLL